MARWRSFRLLAGASSLRSLVVVLTLINSVAVSRTLGASGRGYFQLVLTVALLATAVGGLSLELSVARAFATSPGDGPQLSGSTIVGSALWGVTLGAATLAVITLSGSAVLPLHPIAGRVVVAAFVPILLIGATSQRLLFLRGRPVLAATIQLGQALLVLIATLFMVGLGNLTALRASVAALFGAFVAALWGGLSVGASWRGFQFGTFRFLLFGGARFHPGQLALVLLIRLDIVILAKLTSLGEVGIYAVAVSVVTPIGIFATAVSTTYMSAQFSGPEEDAARRAIRIMHLTLASTLAIAAAAGISAVFLVPAIWGPDFGRAVKPLWLLLPGVIAMSAQRPIGNYLVRFNLHRAMNSRAIIAVVIDVALCLVLIPHFGSSGAAISSTVAYVCYSMLSIRSFLRASGLGFSAFVRPPDVFGGAGGGGASSGRGDSW